MSTRQEVYATIDGECTFQRSQLDTIQPSCIADYLLRLDVQLRRAKDICVSLGEESALHEIRRLASTAVSCMEEFGALPRSIPEPVPEPTPW